MERWVLFAILSMLFAGLTAVVSKIGLAGINSELALAIRSGCVFVLVIVFAAFVVPKSALNDVTVKHVAWLVFAAAASALSLVFYFKAIQQGEVSTVALIDKGSFLVAVALAWLVLGEPITWRTAVGCALILAGLIVVARR